MIRQSFLACGFLFLTACNSFGVAPTPILLPVAATVTLASLPAAIPSATATQAPPTPTPTLVASPTVAATPIPPSLKATVARATQDRADESPNYQIHVLYILPSDGKDQQLDTNGTMAMSLAAMQKWFSDRAGGLHLRQLRL